MRNLVFLIVMIVVVAAVILHRATEKTCVQFSQSKETCVKKGATAPCIRNDTIDVILLPGGQIVTRADLMADHP